MNFLKIIISFVRGIKSQREILIIRRWKKLKFSRLRESYKKSTGIYLKNDGILFTYGVYSIDGKITPESNVRFDKSLKSQNPEWEIRDVRELEKLANENKIDSSKLRICRPTTKLSFGRSFRNIKTERILNFQENLRNLKNREIG